MVVSVLFRIDQNGHSEVVDSGPAVVVDGQLPAESGIVTHASKDLDGELWRWLSWDARSTQLPPESLQRRDFRRHRPSNS